MSATGGQVGHHPCEQLGTHAAALARPGRCRFVTEDHDAVQVRVTTAQIVKLIAEDDLVQAGTRVDEIDISAPALVGQVADRTHHRRDADAAGDHHHARCFSAEREAAVGACDRNPVPDGDPLMQVRGDGTARCALHGDLAPASTARRGGDRIGALHRLAVDGCRYRQELAGLEGERQVLAGDRCQPERLHVRRFLEDPGHPQLARPAPLSAWRGRRSRSRRWWRCRRRARCYRRGPLRNQLGDQRLGSPQTRKVDHRHDQREGGDQPHRDRVEDGNAEPRARCCAGGGLREVHLSLEPSQGNLGR